MRNIISISKQSLPDFQIALRMFFIEGDLHRNKLKRKNYTLQKWLLSDNSKRTY